jgi:LPXTG-site transpeptidase (sortase) family protein
MTKGSSFICTFVALFALTLAFLWVVDAVPNAISRNPTYTHATEVVLGTPDTTSSQRDPQSQTPTQGTVQYPTRVVAKSIGLDVAVVNPDTTDVDQLDTDLEQGAVRYPTSALLGQEGTVLLFGHSSYLPIVYHQYYKTFNGIQNLKAGQIVSVYAGDHEYRYSVTDVTLANADQDVVELPQTGKHLILITCDSFATKSTRYIVKADYVGS